MTRTPLKRSLVRIKAKRSKPRRGPLRSKAYRDWLTTNFCSVCVKLWVQHGLRTADYGMLGRVIDPAHTENNGMRSKGPDSSCAPLCRAHHREYDAGRKAFELKYGIDMKAEAAAHWRAWQLLKGEL